MTEKITEPPYIDAATGDGKLTDISEPAVADAVTDEVQDLPEAPEHVWGPVPKSSQWRPRDSARGFAGWQPK